VEVYKEKRGEKKHGLFLTLWFQGRKGKRWKKAFEGTKRKSGGDGVRKKEETGKGKDDESPQAVS